MVRLWRRLKKDESAAVAATVALSLFGLIAVGGIAFDYARMATLDTELQNAADQAALAGVTQLDGSDDAIDNAITAARGLVTNITKLSNDGEVAAVDIPALDVIFYTEAGDITSDPAVAARIQVSVAPREVFFALTPVVGALKSGPMNAKAIAGLQSSVCNVPPLYMTFQSDVDRGRLVTGTGVELLGAESSSHFGYLGLTDPGGNLVKQALAWDDQQGPCLNTAYVTVKPGVMGSVEKGFNTRFASNAASGGGSGGGGGNRGGNGDCPNKGTCTAAQNTDIFLRDTCHTGTIIPPCTQFIGNGVWPGKIGTQTRYEKYKASITNFDPNNDRRRLTIAVIPFGSFAPGRSDPVGVVPLQWLDVFIVQPISGSGQAMRFYVEVIGPSVSTVSGRRDVPYLLQ